MWEPPRSGIEFMSPASVRWTLYQWATREALKFFKIYFLLWCILSLFLFIYWPHHVACGILVPQPGIEPVSAAVEPASPVLESRFLTTGPRGKSSHHVFLNSSQNTWDSSGSDGMLSFSYLDQDWSPFYISAPPSVCLFGVQLLVA